MQATSLPLPQLQVPVEMVGAGEPVPVLRGEADGPPAISAPARVLLTATLRWPIAARLAIAFERLGCRVEVACPRGHPATHTRAVGKVHRYSTLRPIVSLRQAIETAAPDVVIPCDDTAAVHLCELYRSALLAGPGGATLRAVLLRSLGDPEACPLATARGRFMSLAAAEGVRVPHTEVVPKAQGPAAVPFGRPLPLVMKVDSTWGGLGVAIVHSREDARRALNRMDSRPPLHTAIARTLLDRDSAHLRRYLSTASRVVTVQDFIPGIPANRAVACWQGKVLAGISVAAVRTQDRTGPATVVRVIDNPEMTEATHRLVQRLGLSGMWGIDFVLEAGTGMAYAIEMNPRATPICHLPLGAGSDLPAALVTQLTGRAPPMATPPIADELIAIFPGEWERDRASPHLRNGHHDVPWEEPDLVRDGVGTPWARRGVVARLWAALRHLAPRRAPAAAAARPVTDAPTHDTEQPPAHAPRAWMQREAPSLHQPARPCT